MKLEDQDSKTKTKKKTTISVGTGYTDTPYKFGSPIEEFHGSNYCHKNSYELIILLTEMMKILFLEK